MTNIPLSLYIHFPWCLSKCPYCDFNSYPITDNETIERYLTALNRDLDLDFEKVSGRKLTSVFIGGGTPSLIPINLLEKLYSNIKEKFFITEATEITLEANPGTIDKEKCLALHQLGINRLSIGVQSFQDKSLQKIGRIHNSLQAKIAIVAALLAGFKNINLDLMHGLPEQTSIDAIADLKTAMNFLPQQISWYELTLEPETKFSRESVELPNQEIKFKISEMGEKILAAANYEHYEVSAYARPGFQCKHNRNYWQYGDYLGIGAGAHSKITEIKNNKHVITRFHKHKNPEKYLLGETGFIAEKEIIDYAKIPFEFMLNALRLNEPISNELFTDRTGLTFGDISEVLLKAEAMGLLKQTSLGVETTILGRKFLNNLLELFL
ncbi:MAG: radical SAM family heme chaperone HemW [Gammaproteobacteria bacterium]|nr:radical SAM family heme chaperone HemW [Gammaproteobacteria bacterium]